ncbi:flagellar hook-basal body protein [Ureibacillus manganicus]|uniref:Flagellar hook-basal body protein n=1 Tax=Ureibacillus manganicus DSM 26584 TaxID=1384049 RepID=A0A0A3I5R6_9BACL|nr:flagellar hook-basal body protein [Ureibacillus manganicus]KGR80146.1 flagellar hook-basal body protein [Ureibacillus manganicus DSM 26584]
MLRTMITATNTLNQLQQQIDTISNNLSNSTTAGYKAKEAKFSELLYQQFNNDKLDSAQRQSPAGIRYGVGARISQIQTIHSQGNIQQTDRDLDIALTKEKQYFNILRPNGENEVNVAYSRQGNFYVSPVENGQVMLVNGDGYAVADSTGNAILFPSDFSNFSLTEDGILGVNYPNGETLSVELGITELQKPQAMEHISDTYIGIPENFAELEEVILINLQGPARSEIGIRNGALEQSNVDISKEMTNLITAQRSYQFQSRAITLADQMLGLINGIR